MCQFCSEGLALTGRLSFLRARQDGKYDTHYQGIVDVVKKVFGRRCAAGGDCAEEREGLKGRQGGLLVSFWGLFGLQGSNKQGAFNTQCTDVLTLAIMDCSRDFIKVFLKSWQEFVAPWNHIFWRSEVSPRCWFNMLTTNVGSSKNGGFYYRVPDSRDKKPQKWKPTH